LLPVPLEMKVCVVGGAGGIGQPLCLLVAMDPRVTELCIYDLTISAVPAEGVAADISHINTKCRVTFCAADKDAKAVDVAEAAFTNCNLVLVPAGMPRKPGQDRKDLLDINCKIAFNIVQACAKFCPEAVVALIVNPVNSVVPAMCELWIKAGLNERKIVGVTSLDCVRAEKFVHELTGAPVDTINVPVVGGHAGTTILPLFSQCPAAKSIAAGQIPDLDKKVQDAGTVVVAAKNGKGSATLSMAYAGARLAKAVLSGLSGTPAKECAYIKTGGETTYFATVVEFGKEGVNGWEELPPNLSDHETRRLKALKPVLKEEVDAGIGFAGGTQFEVMSKL